MTGFTLDGSRWNPSLPDSVPALVASVDIADGISSIEAAGASWAYCLVRVHGRVVGAVTCPVVNGWCDASDIASAVVRELGQPVLCTLLNERLLQPIAPHSLSPGISRSAGGVHSGAAETNTADQRVTVAVCTRDRPDPLRRCLESIEAISDPSFDVIVVDNAPSDERTRELVTGRFPRFRYLRELRPGLDWARNTALQATSTPIIAYTDDDTVVDKHWLSRLLAVFVDADVSAVTGLIHPYELRTPAQLAFEVVGGFGRGFRMAWHRIDPQGPSPDFYHLGAGRFGAGANMAFRSDVLRSLGGFDTALDVGTPTEGGGDIEMFFRLLHEGHTLVYEPSAVIFHVHRSDTRSLGAQLATWGTAIGALLTSAYAAYPAFRGRILRFGLRWSWSGYVGPALRAVMGPGRIDRRLRFRPLSRLLLGPSRYRRSRALNSALAAQPGREGARDPIRESPDAIAIVHVDVAEPLLAIDVSPGVREVHVHVSCGLSYLGNITIENRGHRISTTELRHRIAFDLGQDLLAIALPTETLSRVRNLGDLVHWAIGDVSRNLTEFTPKLVSVVIATRNRAEKLRRCLRSVADQVCHFPFEIVVVDNAPEDDRTHAVVGEFPHARYVREPIPGLAVARNAGFRQARGDILVATDDDIVAPRGWLQEIVQPFRFAHIGASTGRVVPLRLDTPAQREFEAMGGLNKGKRSFEVGIDWLAGPRLRPPRVWDVGATANSAYRRSMLQDDRVGLLPESLGPGTPAGGGEDCYHFYRALAAGYGIYYEAAAMLMHEHRDGDQQLKRQMFDYARGHVAYLLTTLVDDRDLRALSRLLFVLPAWHLWRLVRGGVCRRSIVFREIRGYLWGPVGWWKGRRLVRLRQRTDQHPGVLAR